ncbi:MAG: efflux RND transporter periplasmic adaptor subunit [Bacteroidales bacterium]|jgi:RND family efflux transporter MFP subunit|nr:efflux RND transporter periplasmic adaptor subunit [Bacteroidales bacterium]
MKTLKANLITLATLVTLISCTQQKDNIAEKSTAVEVKTSQAAMQDVEQLADFTGTVEAFHPSDITPSLPVRINKIYVEVGDKVHKGQLLVQMDGTQKKQQELQLTNIQVEYDRVTALHKAGGASQQQVDQVKTQLDIMKANLANLAENVNLRSPINGIITDRFYNQGELFSAATGKPSILKVMDLAPLKVKINLPSQYFPNVKIGMPVNITCDVYKDEVFDGKVSLIYPTIDAVTRNFVVEITIPNKNLKVRPGMFSRVTLNFGTQKHIVVDDMAIVRQVGTGDRYLYVEKNGVVSKLKVFVGRQLNKQVEILSDNIQNGDNIIIAGQTKLIDGSAVIVKK